MALVTMGFPGFRNLGTQVQTEAPPPAPAPEQPAPAPMYIIPPPVTFRPLADRRQGLGVKTQSYDQAPPPAPPTSVAPKPTELPPAQVAPIISPGPVLAPPTSSGAPLPSWTVFGQPVTLPLIAVGVGLAVLVVLMLGRRSAPPASS